MLDLKETLKSTQFRRLRWTSGALQEESFLRSAGGLLKAIYSEQHSLSNRSAAAQSSASKHLLSNCKWIIKEPGPVDRCIVKCRLSDC